MVESNLKWGHFGQFIIWPKSPPHILMSGKWLVPYGNYESLHWCPGAQSKQIGYMGFAGYCCGYYNLCVNGFDSSGYDHSVNSCLVLDFAQKTSDGCWGKFSIFDI